MRPSVSGRAALQIAPSRPAAHPVWRAQQLSPVRRSNARVARRRQTACTVSALYGDGGGWLVWTALSVSAAVGQVLTTRTAAGRFLSAPMLAMFAGMAAAAAGVVPPASAAYDTVFSHVMPLAAALCLLEADLADLLSTAGPTFAAFLLGALGTVLGTFVSWQLVGHLMGAHDGAKVAAALCASYIGGSLNFAATATALGLPRGGILAAAMAADNIVMAGYLAIITVWPVPATRGHSPDVELQERDVALHSTVSSASLAVSLACACIAVYGSEWAAARLSFGVASLALVAVAASALGALGRGLTGSTGGAASLFAGSEALGGALILLFFATIGASTCFAALLQTRWVVLFIVILLAVHLSFLLVSGRMLHLPMQSILVGSNANVGGPATAAAMAQTRGWRNMLQPALLTGSFGYAIGTPIGCAVGYVLGS